MKKKFELGEELESLVYALENKIRKETNIGVFTKQETAVLYSAYEKINGSIPPRNCSGCFNAIKKSLTNWLNMYAKPFDMTSKKPNVTLVDKVSGPFKEVEDTVDRISNSIKELELEKETTKRKRIKKVTKK